MAWARKRPHEVRGDHVYLRAYARLSTERTHYPKAIGPIPWSAVDRYARSHGFTGPMSDWFVDVIMTLDAEYREHLRNEEDQAQSKAQRKQDRQTRRDAVKTGIEKRRAAAGGG